MPTYISLVQFTDNGVQAAKETMQRVTDWATRVQSMGVSVKQMNWTLGEYDQVCVFEAPDDSRQRLTGSGSFGQHPYPNAACFHCFRDEEDPGKGAVTRKS